MMPFWVSQRANLNPLTFGSYTTIYLFAILFGYTGGKITGYIDGEFLTKIGLINL